MAAVGGLAGEYLGSDHGAPGRCAKAGAIATAPNAAAKAGQVATFDNQLAAEGDRLISDQADLLEQLAGEL